jgi:ABC-type multidrug transport system fused ATPase/permease subunit
MKNINKYSLYREVNQIINSTRPLRIENSQKSYIKKYLRENIKKLKIVFYLIITVTLIEILLPILIKFFFEGFSDRLEINKLYFGLFFVILISFLYIIISYFAIRNQKLFIINFINKIRKDIIKQYLSKKVFNFRDEDKGKILTRISYHFSLLQMGLNNSLFLFIQWSLYIVGIILICLFIDPILLILSIIFVPINLAILFIGYIISSYYLSQDQTLYSKILRHVSDSFNNLHYIKTFHKEDEMLSKMDTMVELDNHFRVHREILLNIGNRIIFVFTLIVLAGTYITNLYFSLFSFDNGLSAIIYALVIILQIKLIYLSLQIGLFYFPLKLGLCLSVPNKLAPTNNLIFNDFEKIIFKSKKNKLTRNSEYKKNTEFVFERGKRYLIEGAHQSGKTILAGIFSGEASVSNGQKWTLRVNDSFIFYKKWYQAKKSSIYINPFFYSELPLYEIFNDLEKIENLKKYNVFDFIFDKSKFLGESISKNKFSFAELTLLQIFYSLIEKPKLIIIDNSIIDLNHENINAGLQILSNELKDSIIIFMATKDFKTIDKYDSIYKI